MLIHFRQRDGSWLWIKPSFYDPQCEINLSSSVLKQRKAFDLLEAGAKMISICASNGCITRCAACTFTAKELLVQDAIKTICKSKNPKRVADALNSYVEIMGDEEDDMSLWLFFKAMSVILRFAPDSAAAQKWWKALEESETSRLIQSD
jgi:hypothetical protein